MIDPETGTDFIFAHFSIQQLEALESSEHTAKPNAETAVEDYKSKKKKSSLGFFSVVCFLSFKTSVNTFNEIKAEFKKRCSYPTKILIGISFLLSIRNIKTNGQPTNMSMEERINLTQYFFKLNY